MNKILGKLTGRDFYMTRLEMHKRTQDFRMFKPNGHFGGGTHSTVYSESNVQSRYCQFWNQKFSLGTSPIIHKAIKILRSLRLSPFKMNALCILCHWMCSHSLYRLSPFSRPSTCLHLNRHQRPSHHHQTTATVRQTINRL